MDRFNTPWRVTAAAIYTTPTDSRVYGTLDIDVTEAKKYLVRKREEGIKITMVHLATAVLARAIAFDVPEMNCFIRRGAVVGREHMDVMVPVQVGGDTGVTAAIIRNAHARRVSDIKSGARLRRAEAARRSRPQKTSMCLIACPGHCGDRSFDCSNG